MGKDCATILTGFEELQKGEIEKRFGMQRLLPAIRSRDQLIIICTPTILIVIIIIIIIIIITRPKPAYGWQGLAGTSLRASGAQLGYEKRER